jgi:hypothetical protein
MNARNLYLLFFIAIALFAAIPVQAQSIITDSGTYTLNNSDNSTPLATGDLIQFGYYTGATSTSTPFAGTFVALTSNGSGPSTVIGEDSTLGAGDGTFAYYDLDLNVPTASLPPNGQIMSFLIYNSSTVASSTYYAAFATLDETWSYSPSASLPTPQYFGLSDEDYNIVWKNNVAGYTGIALSEVASAPEPQTNALLIAGVAMLVSWRLARQKQATLRTSLPKKS